MALSDKLTVTSHQMACSLYVFGGCGTGGRLNELHCYDPVSNTWAQLPSSDAVPVSPMQDGDAACFLVS